MMGWRIDQWAMIPDRLLVHGLMMAGDLSSIAVKVSKITFIKLKLVLLSEPFTSSLSDGRAPG
jgi:hypothetical protein